MFIPDFIIEASKYNADISIQFNPEKGSFFHINTGAKSDLDIYQVDGKWIAVGRYNEKYEIEDWQDLISAVKDSKGGRDYISSVWEKIIASRSLQ